MLSQREFLCLSDILIGVLTSLELKEKKLRKNGQMSNLLKCFFFFLNSQYQNTSYKVECSCQPACRTIALLFCRNPSYL